MIDPKADLTRAKARNLGHLLFRTARILNELGVARVRKLQDVPGLRAAHMQVLPHIDLEGTRATEIAAKMGITKQAVGQLLDDMEGFGVIERVPDPSDKRARIVRFTAAGREGLLVGLGVLVGIEGELARRVGEDTLDRLKDDLAALLPAVEALYAAEDAP